MAWAFLGNLYLTKDFVLSERLESPIVRISHSINGQLLTLSQGRIILRGLIGQGYQGPSGLVTKGLRILYSSNEFQVFEFPESPELPDNRIVARALYPLAPTTWQIKIDEFLE